jgi:hypothetical protein
MKNGRAHCRARKARAAERKGQSAYEQKRLFRCDRPPSGHREHCMRRMYGIGATGGSLEGVYMLPE